MTKKNILVLAYAISPTRGSEYSSAWNYVNEMSKDNNLVVFYGASGDDMGNIIEMETWLSGNSIPNVRFIPIAPNWLTSKLNVLNRKGIFPYSFYLAFQSWHFQVYQYVKEILEKENFDLIHYFNPTGYREPGYLWKINLPYMWGPIGGMKNRPSKLFRGLSIKNRILFSIRNCVNFIQFRYSFRLAKAFKNTDILLSSTSENRELISSSFNKPSFYIAENGLVNSTGKTIHLNQGEVCNIFWIGTIDARKSLNILLLSLSKITCKNWHLHVIGNGALKSSMQKLAAQLFTNHNISWHGHIPRNKVFELLNSGHLHVITSLGEGTPTTMWETMEYGIPTITLNHCGMRDVVCEKCGVKIDIHSFDQVIDDLAFYLSDLINNPEKINKFSSAIENCSKLYKWSNRRQVFNSYYDMVIAEWHKNAAI